MVLKINTSKINLGELKHGEVKQFSTTVENISNGSVSVKLSASCGCTTPTITKNPIPAGETAEVIARFDTMGKGGFQSKSIYIEYMEGNSSERVVIPFTANVTS